MKVLITADIHIGNYADYNYTNGSRLRQFDLLAKRLIELYNENSCEELWILGDFLRVPNSPQRVNNNLKKFIKTLCSNIKIVRFILGNHDTESKSSTQELDDSIAGLLEFSNFIYEDKKVEIWDNHTFGWMNWRPDQDLSWLDDYDCKKVDVLLGHYTKSNLFGQEIDESRFDLMIHGDIHNDQVIGKFVSVCNPIQHDMSSQADGQCVLLDTATLEWKHIPVDESHTRFLRISYVTEKDKEGFHGPLQYNIYRPELNLTNDSNGEIKTITWDDIDQLINEYSIEKGLLEIHSEVLTKCLPFSEVDFNFQLKHLKIHGYRSIVDFEMDFDKGDRVLLLGENGSGKSSIIRALKGVFEKGVYLTYERSDLADYCTVEVSLFYQNKLYEIKKGDEWRFVIDGEEQNYNNKTAFENDIPIKLPFINYLDLFFITSNVQNLSNQFTPQRRIELISKFYRLDKITAYSQTAAQLLDENNQLLNEKRLLLNNEIALLNNINERIDALSEYSNIDESELLAERDKLTSFKELKSKLDNYENTKKLLQDTLNESKLRLDNYKKLSVIDLDPIKDRISDLKVKIKDEEFEVEELSNKFIEYSKLIDELNRVYEEGNKLSVEVNNIKSGICPECGAKLSEGKSSDLLSQKSSKLNECRKRWTEIDDLIIKKHDNITSKADYADLIKTKKALIIRHKSELEGEQNKLSTLSENHNKSLAEQANYDSLNKRLSELEAPIITEEIPTDLSEREIELTKKLERLNQYKKELQYKLDKESIISNIELDIKNLQYKSDSYYKYQLLTSTTGEIYEEVLKKLAERFTTSEIKYEVESGIYRGNRYLKFNSYYFIRKYRIYESLSDGIRSICDMDFLDKLFSVNTGLLVLDEHLKHLDTDKFQKAVDILTNMRVNTLLLSTHDPNYSNYTKRILLSLDNEGRTQYKIN